APDTKAPTTRRRPWMWFAPAGRRPTRSRDGPPRPGRSRWSARSRRPRSELPAAPEMASRHASGGNPSGKEGGMVAGESGARPLPPLPSLAGTRALLRVLGAYTLFILTEYSVWIAMLVYAYAHGGATIAGLVALAQLVPAAILAPVAAAAADRRSPVLLLAGGYVVQAAAM